MLVADSVGKRFGRRQVLKAATLVVPAGRVTALLGRNGSGKTTLLRIAAGLLRADYGTVRMDGEVHERPRLPRLARRGLFFLPERGLLPTWPVVADLVRTIARRYGAGDPGALLRRLGLGDVSDQRVEALSGGERRRVELAAALARSPRCLLADEPLLGVPPRDCSVVTGELGALADRGCAVVITGHEVGDILETADAVVWLTAGTTLHLGAPSEAARSPEFRARYLGSRSDPSGLG